MKRKILLFFLLTGFNLYAAVPPEIPEQKTIQIFSPFYFDIKDNGESVFVKGGPNLLGYEVIAPEIQTDAPTTERPAVNLETFLELLKQSAGIMMIGTHGWDNKICAEAYEYTDSGYDKAGKARESYKAKFGINPKDMTQIIRVELKPVAWAVCVTPKFMNNHVKPANYAIVYNAACHSYNFWENVLDKRFARNIVGFDGSITFYRGGLFPSESDAYKVADIIFNGMSGRKEEG